jgi:hypothetical protein
MLLIKKKFLISFKTFNLIHFSLNCISKKEDVRKLLVVLKKSFKFCKKIYKKTSNLIFNYYWNRQGGFFCFVFYNIFLLKQLYLESGLKFVFKA